MTAAVRQLIDRLNISNNCACSLCVRGVSHLVGGPASGWRHNVPKRGSREYNWGINMFRGLHVASQSDGRLNGAQDSYSIALPDPGALPEPKSAPRSLSQALKKLAVTAVAGLFLAMPGVAHAQLSQGCQDVNNNAGRDFNTLTGSSLGRRLITRRTRCARR